MSLHPIDPEDEERPCPNIICEMAGPDDYCELCNGTGRLGNPEAEKVIEVRPHWEPIAPGLRKVFRGYIAEWEETDDSLSGIVRNTPEEALAAAREALGREE